MSTSRVFTVGQVLTAAQMNDLPQGILGMTRVTADQGPTSTAIDVITAPAVTIAGTNRRIRIRYHAPGFVASVGGDTFVMSIQEGATTLNVSNIAAPGTGANAIGCDFEAIVDSPTAASHTYKVVLTKTGGTGTGTVKGAAGQPITLTVEDVGIV